MEQRFVLDDALLEAMEAWEHIQGTVSRTAMLSLESFHDLKKPPSQQSHESSPDGSSGRMASRRVPMWQSTLFDLGKLAPSSLQRSNRTTPLDRRFVIDAIPDICRLSNEPHIRQIAEDVLFAHRIPMEDEPSS